MNTVILTSKHICAIPGCDVKEHCHSWNESRFIEELKKANKTITNRHRYSCGLEEEDAELKDGRATFFFNSPDGQNGELYYELKKLGWRHSKYEAEYHWSVRKDNCKITYVEGDIYVTIEK